MLAEGEMNHLALDVSETEDELLVEASLPGIHPEEVDISIVGNSLTIKGESTHEEEREEKGRYHYHERRYGSFQRTITLPAEVNTDAAKAILKNGELRLVLPKVEETKSKRIKVT